LHLPIRISLAPEAGALVFLAAAAGILVFIATLRALSAEG